MKPLDFDRLIWIRTNRMKDKQFKEEYIANLKLFTVQGTLHTSKTKVALKDLGLV